MKRPAHTKPTERFVGYFRVSTQKQGESKLGLEAQREIVSQFIKRQGQNLIAEFTEVESGANSKRPRLIEAIEYAKQHDACLIIAKLDRLSRNVAFISALMESDVKFVACDIPQATNLTVHIFAAMAEFERERISERIKDAHAAKRMREPDWKAGTNNLTDAGRQKAYESIRTNAQENAAHRHAYEFIARRREQGMAWEQIAHELNKEGYRTRRGKKFYAQSVINIYRRFAIRPTDEAISRA